MLIRVVFLIVLFSIQAHSAFAAISSVSILGDTITVVGDGFGEHNLNSQFLADNIESGPDGSDVVLPENWFKAQTTSAWNSPEYTSYRKHSGTKSIKSACPVSSQYESFFGFNSPSTFSEIYITYWVYFDWVDSEAQWKMWRIRPNTSLGDTPGEVMATQWYDSAGDNKQCFFMIFCSMQASASYLMCYPGGYAGAPNGYQLKDVDMITPGEWIRVEIYGKSSDVGIDNGSLYYAITRPGETTHIIRNYSENIITKYTDDVPAWKVFIFQNYWGNVSAGPGTNEAIYIDDPYIQLGSRARVEIGDEPVWANCTHREIQPALTWSDTGITGTFNRGSFNNGDTVYFFVIDEDGIPSDGYPVTIGGETPPVTGMSSIKRCTLNNGALH